MEQLAFQLSYKHLVECYQIRERLYQRSNPSTKTPPKSQDLSRVKKLLEFLTKQVQLSIL